MAGRARTGAAVPLSPSTRPTPRTMTTPSTPNRTPTPTISGGFILIVAIADVAAYVRPGIAARPRGARSRQFGLFPRPRRADAAGAHLQRSLLAAPARGPAGARRADGHRRRWPQALAQLPSRHDALGGEALLCSRRRPPSTARPDETTAPLLDRCCSRFMPPMRALKHRARRKRGPLDLDLPERKILLDDDGHASIASSSRRGSTRTG